MRHMNRAVRVSVPVPRLLVFIGDRQLRSRPPASLAWKCCTCTDGCNKI